MGKISLGFPSPVDDYVEKTLDLKQSFTAATLFMWAQGNSMAGADIYSNDILLVDRPIELVSGEIVICAMGGERKLQKSLA